jgi:hypothetical protein
VIRVAQNIDIVKKGLLHNSKVWKKFFQTPLKLTLKEPNHFVTRSQCWFLSTS